MKAIFCFHDEYRSFFLSTKLQLQTTVMERRKRDRKAKNAMNYLANILRIYRYVQRSTTLCGFFEHELINFCELYRSEKDSPEI